MTARSATGRCTGVLWQAGNKCQLDRHADVTSPRASRATSLHQRVDADPPPRAVTRTFACAGRGCRDSRVRQVAARGCEGGGGRGRTTSSGKAGSSLGVDRWLFDVAMTRMEGGCAGEGGTRGREGMKPPCVMPAHHTEARESPCYRGALAWRALMARRRRRI